MNSELKSVQKGIKADTIFLGCISIIFLVIIFVRVCHVVEYSSKDKSDFVVKLADTDTVNHTQNYYLFVDGEQWYPVNYNVYCKLDGTGNTNVKVNLILREINGILKCIIMEIIFLYIYKMLSDIRTGHSPFVKKSVRTLRIVAVLSMLLAVLPVAVESIGSMAAFQYIDIRFSSVNFYVLAIGVIFGIMSEIFKYGCVLQEDMNQIA